MTNNPIDLLFGGMEKLGPGSDADTLHVLRLLPRQDFRVIVDAGCGTGRQTLALAKELGTLIHAIDNYETFLKELLRRASEANLEPLVRTHCMDMQDIPKAFQGIDLLWSEGAAYNIGFSNALAVWKSALAPRGVAVISELSWLKEEVPVAVREFFQSCYPDMKSVEENVARAAKAGYNVLATHVLPDDAWVDGYYDLLAPRAKALLEHSDAAVREFASETMREIEIFAKADDSYGYVFNVLENA